MTKYKVAKSLYVTIIYKYDDFYFLFVNIKREFRIILHKLFYKFINQILIKMKTSEKMDLLDFTKTVDYQTEVPDKEEAVEISSIKKISKKKYVIFCVLYFLSVFTLATSQMAAQVS